MKKMMVLTSYLVCFSFIAYGMDKSDKGKTEKLTSKRKKHSQSEQKIKLEKKHDKKDVPNLDLAKSSKGKPKLADSSSGTPKPQTPSVGTGTPKTATPKTPVNTFAELQNQVAANLTSRKEDPSTK